MTNYTNYVSYSPDLKLSLHTQKFLQSLAATRKNTLYKDLWVRILHVEINIAWPTVRFPSGPPEIGIIVGPKQARVVKSSENPLFVK